MSDLVTSTVDAGVLVATMDDGKANVMSVPMLTALHDVLDRSEADGLTVVLAGRPDRLSAGFDLATLTAANDETLVMLNRGFELTARLLEHPTPVVVACTGHAIAMGVFVLVAADYRVGAAGPYKITANEVAIGLLMPHTAIELCRSRLNPSYLHRVVSLAEVFTPEGAVDAGLLDAVVPAADVVAAATAKAKDLATLDPKAHAATKRRVRGAAAAAVRAAMATEFS